MSNCILHYFVRFVHGHDSYYDVESNQKQRQAGWFKYISDNLSEVWLSICLMKTFCVNFCICLLLFPTNHSKNQYFVTTETNTTTKHEGQIIESGGQKIRFYAEYRLFSSQILCWSPNSKYLHEEIRSSRWNVSLLYEANVPGIEETQAPELRLEWPANSPKLLWTWHQIPTPDWQGWRQKKCATRTGRTVSSLKQDGNKAAAAASQAKWVWVEFFLWEIRTRRRMVCLIAALKIK